MSGAMFQYFLHHATVMPKEWEKIASEAGQSEVTPQ